MISECPIKNPLIFRTREWEHGFLRGSQSPVTSDLDMRHLN